MIYMLVFVLPFTEKEINEILTFLGVKQPRSHRGKISASELLINDEYPTIEVLDYDYERGEIQDQFNPEAWDLITMAGRAGHQHAEFTYIMGPVHINMTKSLIDC